MSHHPTSGKEKNPLRKYQQSQTFFLQSIDYQKLAKNNKKHRKTTEVDATI